LHAQLVSPENVRRFCCGAKHPGDANVFGAHCTLAIGDHDTHEDLATGVKWSAKRGLPDMQVASGEALDRLATFYGAEPRRHGESCEALQARAWSTVRGAMTNAKQAAGPYRTAPVGPCPNCGGDDATCRGSLVGLRACAAKGAPPPTVQWTSDSGFTYREDVTGNGFRVGGPYHVGVDPAQPGTEATAFVSSAMRKAGESLARFGEAAKRAAESAMRVPAAIEWRHGSASLGQSQAHVIRDGDVYRWQVNHLGLRIRDGVSLLGDEARYEAACLLRDVHEATAGIEWLAGFLGLLFRVHDSTPAAMRAKQEAPLVALVAAVPAGLDPIGWQAAVLAEAEGPGHLTSSEAREFGAQVEAAVRGRDVMVFPNALAAYQRAIAPAPKVDRVRATWKTRGPVLPCDNGWDE
jgi:hypothetical protein